MKKLLIIICTLAVMLSCFVFAAPVSAKAPSDALYYADFNNGPLAQPEESMQATDQGGQLYINDGPISAEADLVDGALKLTLGTSGYYGMNNTSVAFRDTGGNITDFKYLVIRMKGEVGNGIENNLMISIGGGDGPHLGTMASSGEVQTFLDPDGCYMPTITKEYQDFVIALSQSNVRVNEGKLVSGLNFNNSSGSITVYIDEIYLTSEVPEGFVSSGNSANVSAPGNTDDTASDGLAVTTVGSNGGTVAENVVVSSGASSISLPVLIVLLVVIVINFAVLAIVLLKVTKKGSQG